MSKKIEIELKFRVEDPIKLIKKINGPKPKVFYVKDEIFGNKNINYKIRKRTYIDEKGIISEEFEKTIPIKSRIKKVEEEIVSKVPKDFTCENSYDKIRYQFKRKDTKIMLDFYTIGIFLEIEGEEKPIKKEAEKLGFKLLNNLSINIDTIYCTENKNPLLHWGFGKK